MNAGKIFFGALALIVIGAAGFAAGKSNVAQGPVEPTKEHEWLATHQGTWNAKVSGMMGESEGSCKIEAGPGKLWSISHFESTMMGQPFTGMEILGYDPATEQFSSFWIDSMTTTPSIMKGTFDEGSKKLTLKGESVGMDGEVAEMTNVTEYKGDTMVFTMSMPGPDGAVAPMMTIEYTRKK